MDVFTSTVKSASSLPCPKQKGGHNAEARVKRLSPARLDAWGTEWVRRGSVTLWLQNYFASTRSGAAETGGDCRQNQVAGFGAAPESAAEQLQAQAASGVGEGGGVFASGDSRNPAVTSVVGVRRGRPGSSQPSGSRHKARGRRRCEATPWGPAASFLSLPISLFVTTGRERSRRRHRKTGREEKKGARWGARLNSQTHSFLW